MWTRIDNKTIMDGHVVRYKYGERSEISASRNAVMIQGYFEFHDDESFKRFQEKLRAAWSQRRQLKRTNHKPIPEYQISTVCCNAEIKYNGPIAYCGKCGTNDVEKFQRDISIPDPIR